MEELKKYEPDWHKHSEYLEKINTLLKEKITIYDNWKKSLEAQVSGLFKMLDERNETIATLRMRSRFLAETLRGIEDGLSVKEAKVKAAEQMEITPLENKED